MTDARLAQCPRCKAHGLVAERQGIRVAVDIAPVDALGYGNAVAVGPIDMYWVENSPGRGSRVLGRYSGTPRPSWGPGGSQTGTQRLHAEHSCGAPARDMVILNVQRPRSALVTPGSLKGGSHQPDAPVRPTAGRERPSRATYVTPHLSDVLGRCGVCGRMIKPGEAYWSIVHGHVWIDGEHEECP